MIDTHVHAIPLPATRAGMGILHRGVAHLANRVLPAQTPLSIGRLAQIRNAVAGAAYPVLEQAVQLSALPVVLAGGTLGGLLTSMDRHHIQRSVLIGASGHIPNAFVFAAATEAPERIVPVAHLPGVSHDADLEAWVEGFRDLVRQGAAGFKIHPNWDGVRPGHPSYEAAFTVAGEANRFIIIHTGCFHVRNYRDLTPVALHEVEPYFERFPDVRVCLAHMNRERPEEVWRLQRRYDAVYTDTSWQPAHVIRRAIDRAGSERLMLGSDWPLLHLGLQRDARDTAQRAATGQHAANILEDAPARFLGED